MSELSAERAGHELRAAVAEDAVDQIAQVAAHRPDAVLGVDPDGMEVPPLIVVALVDGRPAARIAGGDREAVADGDGLASDE